MTLLNAPNVVAYKDVMQFCDDMRGFSREWLHQRLGTLGPENCKIDLHDEVLIIRPAKDWSLAKNQPFKVEIIRTGTAGGERYTSLSVESSGHEHWEAELPLREVLDSFRASCNLIRVLKIEQ